MKWLSVFAVATAITIAVVGYQAFTPITTLRYRLTLEAEVNGKRLIGSGIVEVTYAKAAGILSPGEYGAHVRGEAVILDLGARGLLFALLRAGQDSRSGPDYIVLRAFNLPGGALPRPAEDGIRQVARLSGKVELPLTSLPLLVRFRDVNDPLTVEKVDPLDLAASFGAGVRLTTATLEIVSSRSVPMSWIEPEGEPITTGIVGRLPWLVRIQSNIDGTFSTSSNRLSNVLHSGDFERK